MAEVERADDALAGSPKNADKDAANARVRRRNRMITSCLECRRRKLKCDKQHPCTNCNKFSRECVFLAPALDSVSQKRLNEIKEKMGTLERTLEEDVARRNSKAAKNKIRRESADLPGEGSESEEENDVPDYEKGLEATPYASVDASYEDDAREDVMDLGFRVGKFRMTERLGGLFRPKIAEEMVLTLIASGCQNGTEPQPPLMDNQTDFLEPGTTFIAPGSGFVFGDIGSRRSLVDFLPTKAAGDLLIQRYRENVHFIARVVHWPSFQVQYENFWRSILSGFEPPASLQALVFSVMFSAVASMKETEITGVFSAPKSSILVNFQTATEVSLGKAQFLRTSKFETLQALVIYLIPMCRGEISRAHSVLVGAAIRLGECFGLHRDPKEAFGTAPIETHVRRILWYQLCFLDFRTAEAQGPRPGIKREDYDTRLPCNINDIDLITQTDPKDREQEWTDMTLTRLRFECVEMQRICWHDRIRLDKKKISITHCLGKIESFRKAIDEKYKFLDVSIPIQQYARLVLDTLALRMHIMILHKYHNAKSGIPDRLRQIVLSSGTKMIESAVELDKLPQFEPWRWMNAAHQQWHTAFLMLNEVCTHPNRREADRIWAVCDYVFQPDLSLNRLQKGRSIMATVRDRAAAYRNLRKMRDPVAMKKGIEAELPTRLKPSKPENNTTNEVSTTNLAAEPSYHDTSNSSAYVTSAGSSVSPNPPHATISSEKINTSWTFDSPFSMYGPPAAKSPAAPNTSDSRNTGASPGQQLAASPSTSSGITDSWPPFLTSNQQPWRLVQAASASPPQHTDGIAGSPPQYGNSAMGLVSGQFIPEISSGTSGSSPPFIRHGSVGSVGSYDAAAAAYGGEFGPGAGPVWNQQGGNQQPQDQPMLEIDWGEWDKLFPPETNSGNLDMPNT